MLTIAHYTRAVVLNPAKGYREVVLWSEPCLPEDQNTLPALEEPRCGLPATAGERSLSPERGHYLMGNLTHSQVTDPV